MANSRLRSFAFYAGLTALLWLIGLAWIPFRTGLRELSWIGDVVGYLVGGVCSAIAIAMVASREERLAAPFIDNLSRRMGFGLHTMVNIAGVFGLASLIISVLPYPADRFLHVTLGMATVPTIFAAFIAGATGMRPTDAIVTGVKFFFTQEGIKTFVRPAILFLPIIVPLLLMGGGAPEKTAEMRLFVPMALVCGIVYVWLARSIWARFGRREADITR